MNYGKRLILLLIALLISENLEGKKHDKYQDHRSEYDGLQIEGPRCLTDRIGIVGAGAAGIHMAYLLKEKGFKHITIFEKSDRIGGKSKTINYRGVPQEMGTSYLTSDYEENVIELVRKFTSDSLLDLPSPSIWLDRFPLQPIAYSSYIILESMKNFKTNNITIAVNSLIRAIGKYKALHQQLFGTYKGELMSKPNATVLYAIRGTFLEFLKRNDLQSLEPLFLASYAIQGYGALDEAAALYGLLWNTPKIMNSLLARVKGSKSAGVWLLKYGFQNLWNAIAEKEQLKIEYQKAINWVHRTRTGTWLCWEKYICRYFDFVVWTPELKQSLKMFHPVYTEEWKLFKEMESVYVTTSLVNSVGVIRGLTPSEYWFDNWLKKRENSVLTQRDSFATIQGFVGPDYQKGAFSSGNDGLPIRTTVVYQVGGKSKPLKQDLNDILIGHLQSINGTDVHILETDVWRYFPRFKPCLIGSGILWDILELQGKYGMWYAGSSVIFESVKSVVEYNKLLVGLMKPPYYGNDEVDNDNEENEDDRTNDRISEQYESNDDII